MATAKEKNRLKKLVTELKGNLSQRAFANMLNVSYTAVQHWEKGAESEFFPNDGNLAKIANAKGWTVDELKRYLATGKIPETGEFSRLLDQIKRLHPDQSVIAMKALVERIEFFVAAE